MQPLDIGVSAISAGTTAGYGGVIVFSDSNNISFGINGHTVTATVAAAGVTAVSGIGVSTGGNTSGTTGTVVGTVVLAGINNITLSQATAAGPSATITISGRDAIFGAGVSTGGNTSGTTGTVTGTLVFAGGNNITLSQSTNAAGATITISAANSATVVSAFGVSTGGNTSGNTGTTVGTVVLAGGNNITLSQDTAAGSLATITISARNAIFGAGVSTGGNTSGTTGTVTGTLVLAGGNHVTLSQSTNAAGATITVSGDNAVFGIGISTGGNTSGTSGTNTGTFVLVGGNGITLSQATGAGGNTVTISGFTQSTQPAVNIAAGTQTATSGTVVFSNSNNVTFGMSNNSVVTASIGNVATTVSAFSHNAEWGSNWVVQQGILSLQRVTIPVNISASSGLFVLDLKAPPSMSGGITLSMGIYTFTGGTASLSTSFSGSTTWTSGGATSASSIYGGVSGTRYRAIGAVTLIPPGDYLIGIHILTTNAGTWNIFGRQAMSIVGQLALPVNITNNFIDGISVSSFSTLMPSSVIVSDTGYNRTGQSALRQPGFIVLTA